MLDFQVEKRRALSFSRPRASVFYYWWRQGDLEQWEPLVKSALHSKHKACTHLFRGGFFISALLSIWRRHFRVIVKDLKKVRTQYTRFVYSFPFLANIRPGTTSYMCGLSAVCPRNTRSGKCVPEGQRCTISNIQLQTCTEMASRVQITFPLKKFVPS